MNPTIEDSELNAELQELYIISNHWLADLDYFQKDIKILREFIIPGLGSIFKELEPINRVIAQVESNRVQLKSDVENHLKLLRLYIHQSEHNYKLSLVESHVLLEAEIGSLLQSFKCVKQKVFKQHAVNKKAQEKTVKREI